MTIIRLITFLIVVAEETEGQRGYVMVIGNEAFGALVTTTGKERKMASGAL